MPMKISWVSRGRAVGWLICGAAGAWLQDRLHFILSGQMWPDFWNFSRKGHQRKRLTKDWAAERLKPGFE